MAMNRIQFQNGMSLFEHFRQFRPEAQCAAALERTRSPNGLLCPRCGGAPRSRPFSTLDGPRSTTACAAMRMARTGYKRTTLFLDGYDVHAAATTGPFAGAQNGHPSAPPTCASHHAR
jgi:hypothetical protein